VCESNVTQRTDIAIVGRACRLPGAPSVDGLWQLLTEARCAVGRIPGDRWSLDRFGHPRAQERGKSYTWAAGVLDDIWSFDPAVFGISPREAEQMDPQQRLLLELTWEALEDAGMRPSSVAGSPIGVYVGASSLDYGNLRILDVPSGDAYAATGNTLSILSNRISYIFDLKGPSFTVDTACSSSLVALDNAVAAIRSGRVDTAVVAGVNVLASPFNFICFSNAQMLSRTGLCQAFSASSERT
jgi:phthiocerol/phenolphthiocerol synthesis type-I polyketide synthase C